MNIKHTHQFIAVIFTLLIGSFAASVSATTYYLDATNGDDSWNGTDETFQGGTAGPWKKIDKVAAFSASPGFQPGDQILFKRGETFRTILSIPILDSGNAQDYIEFGAYGTGSEKPILQIQMRKLSVSTGNSWFWQDQGNGVWLYTYTGTSVGGVWNDNVHLKHASDLNLTDGDFYWDSGTGIYYRPDDNNPLDDEIYRGLTAFGFDLRGVSYIRLNDLRFSTGYRPLTGGGILHNIVIEDCEFDNTRTAINFVSGLGIDDITIQNNSFTSNARSIIVHSGNGASKNTNIVIKNNLVIDTDTNRNFEDFEELQGGNIDVEAISMQNANDSFITDNILHDGASEGAIIIWTHPSSTTNNNEIARNKIHNIVGAGINLFGSNTLNTNIGNIVHHNEIYNCTDFGGIRLSAKDDPGSNAIYNNTIVNCGNSFFINGTTSGFSIFNNISLNPTGHHVQYNHTVFASQMDNNIYYPDTASSFLLLNNTNKTLSQWQTDTGQDLNSASIDPLLADINTANFNLTASSPAIDVATAIGQTMDIDNNPILGPPDIGAYEFGHNDSDGDGVIDYDEICFDGDCQSYNPYDSVTNPSGGDINISISDTDGDGSNDGDEIAGGTDPLNSASTPTISAPAMGLIAMILLWLGLTGIGFGFSKSRIAKQLHGDLSNG